jgi:hypothetical protein
MSRPGAPLIHFASGNLNPTATLFPLPIVRTVGYWQLACGSIKRGAKQQGLYESKIIW